MLSQEHKFVLRQGDGALEQRFRHLLRIINLMYDRRKETRERGLHMYLPRVWMVHRNTFIVEVSAVFFCFFIKLESCTKIQ